MQSALGDQPRLITWVARTSDIERAVASSKVDPGPAHPMSRGDFRWRITIPDDGRRPGGGVLPTLIQWDVAKHPADGLPDDGVSLVELAASHPAPETIRSALAALGLSDALRVTYGAAPRLAAMLRTPRGTSRCNRRSFERTPADRSPTHRHDRGGVGADPCGSGFSRTPCRGAAHRSGSRNPTSFPRRPVIDAALVLHERLESMGRRTDDRKPAQPSHEGPEPVVPTRPGERALDCLGQVGTPALAAERRQLLVVVPLALVGDSDARDARCRQRRPSERRVPQDSQRLERDHRAETLDALSAVGLVAAHEAHAQRRERRAVARDGLGLRDARAAEALLDEPRAAGRAERGQVRVSGGRIEPPGIRRRRDHDPRVAPLQRERGRRQHRAAREMLRVACRHARLHLVRRHRHQRLADRVGGRLHLRSNALVRRIVAAHEVERAEHEQEVVDRDVARDERRVERVDAAREEARGPRRAAGPSGRLQDVRLDRDRLALRRPELPDPHLLGRVVEQQRIDRPRKHEGLTERHGDRQQTREPRIARVADRGGESFGHVVPVRFLRRPAARVVVAYDAGQPRRGRVIRRAVDVDAKEPHRVTPSDGTLVSGRGRGRGAGATPVGPASAGRFARPGTSRSRACAAGGIASTRLTAADAT
ncbi:MAG: VOC family protein [Betaproteobacteria bacterium]|nr:VOC family protein [Betaproteobacteria bacterium]